MTGLLLGSFNPVHNGHLALAKELLKSNNFAEIWFVLSPQNPLKQQAGLLNDNIRLQMLDLALENEPKLKSCNIEFSLPKPNYTINTLAALKKQYPGKQFSIIIGADNLAIFHLWKDYEIILNEYPIVVYPRQGTDLETLKQKYPQVSTIEAPLFPVSSSQIKQLLCEGKPVVNYLPKQVEKFIVQHKIYQ